MSSLDKDLHKNYHPHVKAYPCVKRIVKVVVADSTTKNLSTEKNNPSNLEQSLEHSYHSTESGLLKNSNDLHFTTERKEVTAPTFPDLSAVFDTTDYSDFLASLGPGLTLTFYSTIDYIIVGSHTTTN